MGVNTLQKRTAEQEEQYRKAIIAKMRLISTDAINLCNAMYLGKLVHWHSLEDIKTATDKMAQRLAVYFGTPETDILILQLQATLHIEVKNYYSHLTMQELNIGFNRALRGVYGEFYFKKISLKLFHDLINLYLESPQRKGLRKQFNDIARNFEPTDFISDEEKEELAIHSAEYLFNQFNAGDKTIEPLMRRQYDWLVSRGIAITDYQPYMLAATQQVVASNRARFTPKDREGQSLPLNELVNRELITSATNEAKRMALAHFYTTLSNTGQSIRQLLLTIPIKSKVL